MPGLANHAGDGGKRHLTAHRQNEGLEEQREPRKLARPIGFDEHHPAIGKFDPRRSHFEIAFMLEEVEMPVALCLGVVDRMQSFRPFVRKPAAFGEIDSDGQEPLAGVERDIAHVPGGSDAKGRSEKFVAHARAPAGSRGPRPGGDHDAAMLAAVKNKPCGWPLKERPFLTATARDGPIPAQAGAEEWPQPNKGMLLVRRYRYPLAFRKRPKSRRCPTRNRRLRANNQLYAWP